MWPLHMFVLCGVLLSRVGNNMGRRILRDVASTHIDRMWCVVVTIWQQHKTSRVDGPWPLHIVSFYDFGFHMVV